MWALNAYYLSGTLLAGGGEGEIFWRCYSTTQVSAGLEAHPYLYLYPLSPLRVHNLTHSKRHGFPMCFQAVICAPRPFTL